jgi:hypothetical protein
MEPEVHAAFEQDDGNQQSDQRFQHSAELFAGIDPSQPGSDDQTGDRKQQYGGQAKAPGYPLRADPQCSDKHDKAGQVIRHISH